MTPFITDAKGEGPAWANSLFEDNAEYGYGMRLATDQKLTRICEIILKISRGGHYGKYADKNCDKKDKCTFFHGSSLTEIGFSACSEGTRVIAAVSRGLLYSITDFLPGIPSFESKRLLIWQRAVFSFIELCELNLSN